MEFILSHAYLAVGGVVLGVLLLWALIAAVFLALGGGKRPFLLGPVFAAVHIAVIAIVALTTPSDWTATPLAGMGWLVLSIADFPVTLLFPRSGGDVSLPGFFILFGTVQQLAAGTLFAAVYTRRRRRRTRPL
jgi:hypothetical protein